jgi:putative NADH-flavin reductase
MVRKSGLDWIIVRPVILTNGPKTGRYKVLNNPKDWRSGTISRADVADFLVKQVQDPAYLGKTPVLTS